MSPTYSTHAVSCYQWPTGQLTLKGGISAPTSHCIYLSFAEYGHTTEQNTLLLIITLNDVV